MWHANFIFDVLNVVHVRNDWHLHTVWMKKGNNFPHRNVTIYNVITIEKFKNQSRTWALKNVLNMHNFKNIPIRLLSNLKISDCLTVEILGGRRIWRQWRQESLGGRRFRDRPPIRSHFSLGWGSHHHRSYLGQSGITTLNF